MESTSKDAGENRDAQSERDVFPDSSSSPGSSGDDASAQQSRDEAEQAKHPRSENELESTQDKNPVPPGSTRR